MTTKEIQIETLIKVRNEIVKKALRYEDILYNDTAMNIYLEAPYKRFKKLKASRDKVKLKAKTMWEISGNITKQIVTLNITK